MTTIYQAQKKKRIFKKKFVRVKALQGCPQKRGICTKIVIMNPKKPNSADRKVAKLRLTTKRRILAYIVGLGHNLQEHASVLIKGGRVRDLPGMHYRLVKGKLDFSWKEVFGRRKQRRSKYGVPTIKGPKMRRRKKKHKKKIIKSK